MSSEKVGRLFTTDFFFSYFFPFFYIGKKRKWTFFRFEKKNKMPFLNTTDRFEVFARPSVSSVCVFVKTFAAHHSRLLIFCQFFFKRLTFASIIRPTTATVKHWKSPSEDLRFFDYCVKGNADKWRWRCWKSNKFVFIYFYFFKFIPPSPSEHWTSYRKSFQNRMEAQGLQE